MKLIDQESVSAGEYHPKFINGTPFLVEGCMIIQCLEGSASFSLDFHKFDIRKDNIVFLFNDMVVELGERSDDFRIRYVSVTDDFTFEIYLSITSKQFWERLYLSPVQRFKDTYLMSIDSWMKECMLVYNECSKETSDAVIPSMVINLFTVMEDIITKSEKSVTSISNNSAWEIVGNFLVLLSRNYVSQHKVSFYANALSITPDYLSAITKECTRITPKETIEGKLVLTMKALLENTNMSIKNIAERLRYEDSSHLCKVFRRHTGMSPGQYRKQQCQ